MLTLIDKGGPLMWVILAGSVIAMLIFLERFFHLHRAQIRADDFLQGLFNVVRRGNIVEAVTIAEETPGPVADIARAALLHHDEGAEAIRRALVDTGNIEIPRLERNLGLLGTLARVLPVVGLLGTVLGLMETLMVVEQQAPLVTAGEVSGGVWQALITTAAALAAAIPAYVGYNFLIGRVEAIVLDMDHAANELITFLTSSEMSPDREPAA